MANEENSWMIATVASPAVKDASTYFQMVESMGATPKFIGFPAYQKAGIKRIQKETVQAPATPDGPHLSPSTKSKPVTVNSTSTQRNQRSAFPRERWSRPMVW